MADLNNYGGYSTKNGSDLRAFPNALYQKMCTRKSKKRQLSAYKKEEGEAVNPIVRQHDADEALIFSGSNSDKDELAVRRRRVEETNDTDQIRKRSRHDYLQRIKEKKLLEIEQKVRDHENLFEGVKLSQAEGCRLSSSGKEENAGYSTSLLSAEGCRLSEDEENAAQSREV